jgi:hypothetical protein
MLRETEKIAIHKQQFIHAYGFFLSPLVVHRSCAGIAQLDKKSLETRLLVAEKIPHRLYEFLTCEQDMSDFNHIWF